MAGQRSMATLCEKLQKEYNGQKSDIDELYQLVSNEIFLSKAQSEKFVELREKSSKPTLAALKAADRFRSRLQNIS